MGWVDRWMGGWRKGGEAREMNGYCICNVMLMLVCGPLCYVRYFLCMMFNVLFLVSCKV